MAEDARFEDVPLTDQPLRLKAEGDEDLQVISSLLQDAVGKTGEIAYARGRRRLALMLNRFRWEDREAAERQKRGFERVQTLLTVEDVIAVRARALAPDDGETVYSVLSVGFLAEEDGTGMVQITLAGDGELVAEVECLSVTLEDVSRPWLAASGKAPEHKD
ncbi:MAG: DUF2948 family protein [Pseudomonadota bacterium]